MQKDYINSQLILEECLEIIKELGDRRVYVTPLNTLGNVALELGEYSAE